MTYPGGKNAANAYRAIINQIPPHDLFVEGFGGSAAITAHKRPARESYVIEKNPAVASRSQFRLTAAEVAVESDCSAAKVLTGDVFTWLNWKNSWLGNRLNMLGARALVYLEAELAALLKLVRGLRCPVIVSHYRCPFYDAKLRDWRRVDFRTGSRGGLKVESLYCNFPDPAVLHDYRFAGANKDRRQRLKRRIATLLAELAALPPVEANAIREAIAAGAVGGDC